MNDYSKISAVCFDCAMVAGFTPKNKVAGVWVSDCGICRKRKPCTDLWHDWVLMKESEMKLGPLTVQKLEVDN